MRRFWVLTVNRAVVRRIWEWERWSANWRLSGDGEEIESSRREKGKEITRTCPTGYWDFLLSFSFFYFPLFKKKKVGQPGQVSRQAGQQNRPWFVYVSAFIFIIDKWNDRGPTYKMQYLYHLNKIFICLSTYSTNNIIIKKIKFIFINFNNILHFLPLNFHF
jgi:hypothetical protein